MKEKEPDLRPFQESDIPAIQALLHTLGWTGAQIEGQIQAVNSQAGSGFVCTAWNGDELLGYISVQFYAWNRLGQIHGLAVAPHTRRRGIATTLLGAAEKYLKETGARGVYFDTPVDNEAGRRFYLSCGFREAYTMPEYYAEGQDGVTYIKFFR